MEASASGTELMTSRLPSPSMSTARRRKVEGMNWVLPKAPAHEPLNSSSLTSPLIEDFQRREQFAMKIVGAAVGRAGQRCQRLDDRTGRRNCWPKSEFDAPDRDRAPAHRRRNDAGPRAPPADIAAKRCLAVAHPLVVDEAGDIIPDRCRKFRLGAEKAHGVIGLQAVEGAGKRGLGNALGRRLRLDLLLARGKIRAGRLAERENERKSENPGLHGRNLT